MRRLLTLSLLFSVCCQLGVLGQVMASTPSTIQQMNSFLATQNIDKFLDKALKEGWKAPIIYSKWHIEQVASTSEKGNMNEAREFGKLLAEKLADASRWESIGKTNTEAQRISTMFLDLADWLNQSAGFGNIILGARCLDLASIGVGRCIIDPAFPEKDIITLVARMKPIWLESQARKEILNKEAGSSIFLFEQNKSKSDQAETLKRIWATGQSQALEAKSPSLKAVRIRNQEASKKINEKQKTQINQNEEQYFDRPEILAKLPFFADSLNAGPVTLVSCWDKKNHDQIVNGLTSENISKIEALAMFREKVGGFPSNFNVEHPFFTGGKAAFDLAWKPYATKETRLLYVIAWQAYDELKRGVFLDQETKLDRCLHSPITAP